MKELQETRVWVEAGGVCGRVTASPWVSDNCEPAPVETTLQNAFLTTSPQNACHLEPREHRSGGKSRERLGNGLLRALFRTHPAAQFKTPREVAGTVKIRETGSTVAGTRAQAESRIQAVSQIRIPAQPETVLKVR